VKTELELSLMGRVALVTGGGRGIGEGIAQSLAEAGADVTIADFDLPKTAATQSRR
jgi:meso-butanediol dehydrogenase/(S,S)-butanediol dehydrogenase/diacetyl reductase